ncbi:MAG: class I SAM-dependent rRNA methyltransferase [Saprospiraceae bacterium]|nr:class I SAM-dependent rRNA methyltransferase [Saprospiraceae bacterium]
MKSIIIFSSKSSSVLRKHPWIFSGALKLKPDNLEEGELVQVENDKAQVLGFGHYQNNNIAIKLLGFSPDVYSDNFWNDALQKAYDIRKSFNLSDSKDTDAYRLVHGEGDNLPGLIIDIYGKTAVIQCHSVGMYNNIKTIADILLKIYNGKINNVFIKSKDTLSGNSDHNSENKFLFGGFETVLIKENNLQFEINLIESQKTGFFLDQRDNRKLLMQYAKDKNVLNTFCYTGGFSLYALTAQAQQVDSIDSSKTAIAQLNKNIEINFPNCNNHNSICEDAIHYLNTMPSDQYDLIILDPPAFAKNISKRHNAIQAYKRININALKKIKSGGILFTFSCSQVVTEELFYHTIISAGIESGRKIQILHKLHQGPDHPVNLFHPEGAYLKGMVLRVE